MADDFTDVSSQSWFGRIGGAIKGFIFGLILLPIAIFLLFWNETRAVHTANRLKEGASKVVSVAPDAVVPGNDQKLIHLTGEVTTAETIHDPIFALSATALRIARHAETYQWEEKKSSETHKKLGGGDETVTKYEYTKTWSPKLIATSTFKHPEEHTNPATMPVV